MVVQGQGKEKVVVGTCADVNDGKEPVSQTIETNVVIDEVIPSE
jgi:hypothetical protein